MSFTRIGNQKMAARLIAEKGIDPQGKSYHHKLAGKKASHKQLGYFALLKQTPEGRERLAEIGRLGAKASNKKQGKGAEGAKGEDQKTEGL